ncbi:hypothetical protein [Aliamphritea spongicola]|uniref:hypothetical protein n=1 Tax=Aliamphritea spongicola TaxID=707589 RepID=UPI00196A48AB|nr:hypothetical protein [Aliamphritea spongicola]MBN3561298.1 hypothetical protein [Aliamphritea spongicola]
MVRKSLTKISVLLYFFSAITLSSAYILTPDLGRYFSSWISDVSEEKAFQDSLIIALEKLPKAEDKSEPPLQSQQLPLGGDSRTIEIIYNLLATPGFIEFFVNNSVKYIDQFSENYNQSYWLIKIGILCAVGASILLVVSAFSAFWSSEGYSPSEDISIEERKVALTAELRGRATKLRNQASLILLLIGSTCAVSFTFFYYSSDPYESNGFRNASDDLRQSNQDVAESIRDLQEILVSYDYALNSSFEMESDSNEKKYEATVEIIKAVSKTATSELITMPDKAQVIVQEASNSLMTALLDRIGSIVITVFIVVVLVPTYRYCISLASFYDARADALILSNDSSDNKKDLQGFFQPEEKISEKRFALVTRPINESES